MDRNIKHKSITLVDLVETKLQLLFRTEFCMLVKGQKHRKQNYSISNRFYTYYDYLGDSHTLTSWP